jgi:hypothetical protein
VRLAIISNSRTALHFFTRPLFFSAMKICRATQPHTRTWSQNIQKARKDEMNIRRMQRSVRPKVQMKSQEARASRRGGHARVAFLAAMYQRPSRGENIETFSCTRSYGEEEKEGAGVPRRYYNRKRFAQAQAAAPFQYQSEILHCRFSLLSVRALVHRHGYAITSGIIMLIGGSR